MAPPTSSEEGEIIESVVEDLKATSLPYTERNGVDRKDRPRRRYSPSRSPDRNNGDRRSNSPRGYKRSRDDRDHHDHNGGRYANDSRRFRSNYDDNRGDHRRQRRPYHDLDRPSSRSSNTPYYIRDRDRDHARDRDRERDRSRDRYADRDREAYPEKRLRNRSRSPYRRERGDRLRDDRHKKDERRFERPGDYLRTVKYDDNIDRDSRAGSTVSKRSDDSEVLPTSKNDAKPGQGYTDEQHRPLGDTESYTKQSVPGQETVEEPEPEPFDEDAEIERRRKRREALLAKSNPATPLLIHALHGSDRSLANSPQSTGARNERAASPQSGKGTSSNRANSANSPDVASPASNDYADDAELGAIGIINDQDLMNTHTKGEADDEDGPSAADYDPTADMKEDGLKDEKRFGNVGLHGERGRRPSLESSGVAKPALEKAKDDDNDDDDDFNMFAEDFDVDKYAATKSNKAAAELDAGTDGADGGGLLEDVDKDGYYKIRIGEVINGRYQVQTTLGKGMFSGVVRAVDITNKQLAAIKIMRNNDALRKGGFTEIAILQKLNEADPDNRKHIVRFWRHFDHKGHLCMAFENLSLNLREVLKKFGNNVGINLNATRAYAHQIFVGLAHLRKCGIIHADLKPDNILVNESRNVLKICDLGTAIDKLDAATAHNEITPYLVSRFYRAPEIMLGMPYDYAIDMWSIGCTLYELYTGKILFTGDSNNQMLKSIMEIRGKIAPKTYRRGELAAMHFDEKGNFVSVERDKILGKTTIKTLPLVKPTRDLRTRLMAASNGMDDAEAGDLNHFIDLLEHCLALNPDKRIKPTEALKHPFFTSRATVNRR
ncbi:hypothetical protein jhhlp_006803 [Lomentospora prolificans]|uniref:non-specific serine/threonine protein kinase n=1 Tax=Lomentospora prolificans TaxID=41688 RepID=A0A2N3N2S3_9PEZI|nr:hypothetical protein jhhlp_006803 [Lomentospora prolificans]